MKNYIFLDMDGVLNNEKFHNEWMKNLKKEMPYLTQNQITIQFMRRFIDVTEFSFYNGFIVPENLKNWNRLIASVNANVVFSSDWRKIHFDTGDMLADVSQVQELFNQRDMKGKVVGVTPMTYDMHRGREIFKWLVEHNPEEERRVLVLDDLSEVKDLKYDKVATEFKFIQTDYMKGLTSANVDEAIAFLNKK